SSPWKATVGRMDSGRFPRLLIGADAVHLPQGQIDVVEPLEEALTPEGIDLELRPEPTRVRDHLRFEVDRHLRPRVGEGTVHELSHLRIRKRHRKESILET